MSLSKLTNVSHVCNLFLKNSPKLSQILQRVFFAMGHWKNILMPNIPFIERREELIANNLLVDDGTSSTKQSD